MKIMMAFKILRGLTLRLSYLIQLRQVLYIMKGDKYDDCPPYSFPAKMTVLLHHRYHRFNGVAYKGFLIPPVELI